MAIETLADCEFIKRPRVIRKGFPIYYQGSILFRNGRPAMSTKCCCCPSTSLTYFLCFGDNNGYRDIADQEFPQCAEIFYKGRVRDTLGSYDGSGVPDGTYYYGFLWLVRVCLYAPDTQEQAECFELFLSGVLDANPGNKYTWGSAEGSVIAGLKDSCLSTPIDGEFDPDAPMNSPDLVEDLVGNENSTPSRCTKCRGDC